MSYFKKHFLYFVISFFAAVNLFSCTSTKTVVYFNDLKDSAASNLQKDTSALVKLHKAVSDFDNPIQKNDQLWITVGGSNLADLLIVNSANGASASAMGSQTQGGSITGFLVEANGKVKLPYLGMIQAEGLTRLQLEAFLTEKFKDYTKDPVVNVRFMNYNFSVMGEVAKPGRYNMPTERTTILEAISLAGDITDLGKRDNVLLIREVNGQRDFIRINLLSKNIFNSPYYYLKTNDVIYIEPVRTRFINRTGVPQYLSIVAIGLSLLITIINVSK